MKIIDHTDQLWDARYRRHSRTNGAATYSRDIVKYHVPIWKKFAPDDTVVSTAPLITNRKAYGIPDDTKLLVQYVHRYQYDSPLADAKRVTGEMGGRQVLFVTAYKQYANLLNWNGYRALWLPMTIDAEAIRKFQSPEHQHHAKKLAYFGNLLHGKELIHADLVKQLNSFGWEVDTFANNRKNGKGNLSQSQILREISTYDYGIGVGRCALEMYALGLKILVIGGQFGGLVMSPADFEAQLKTNFNGRIITYDRTLEACLAALPHSESITSDIKEQLPFIERLIAGVLI